MQLRLSRKVILGIATSLIFAMGFSGAAVIAAKADPQREVGTLTCVVEGGVGFIIGSTKDLTCTFDPYRVGPLERYAGEINKVGLDIGVTTKTVIVWGVYTNPSVLLPGQLAGSYTGVASGASLGAGIGAKVLIGGSRDAFSLQPLSIDSKQGINVAIAIAQLNLRFVSADRQPAARPIRYRGCGSTVNFASGDTLYEIAARCGTNIDAILEVNPTIKNVNEILPGTPIAVPKYKSRLGKGPCGSHTLAKSGENLFAVSQRCGTTTGAIIDANPGIDTLHPLPNGTTVNIPPYATPIARRSCGSSIALGPPNSGWGNLDEIAEHCGLTVDSILEKNPSIKNVREIPTGKIIYLPTIARVRAAKGCGTHTTAKENETIFTVARRCGTTAGALVDANSGLRRFRVIPQGRVIDIPSYAIPAQF